MIPTILADCVCPTGEVIDRTSSVLLSGGVVVYPSDTVYGLLCSSGSQDAIEKLGRLKGLSAPRQYIRIVDGFEMALSLAAPVSRPGLDLLHTCWPGQVTFVLPGLPGNKCTASGSDGSVAIRYPAHRLSTALVSAAGMPLISSSANLHGGSESMSPEEVSADILESADLLLDGGRLPPSPPSTIVRIAPDGCYEVLRGSLPEAPGSN